jgi:tetratricopeptide (TPR) repeat protein
MAQSLQDIIKRRQREEFVGREEQLILFRRNLRREIDDPRRRFVVNVFGQGGVGKTWLLRRFRKIAEECGAVTAYTDEAEEDVPGVLGRLAEQFKAQDYPLKTFADRYEEYRQGRQEIEADPDILTAFPRRLGRTVIKGGLGLVGQVPGIGGLTELMPQEAWIDKGGEFAAAVARKLKNKDLVQVVLHPDETLTPLFLADLRAIAKEHPIALFFDTYERTGSFLDSWLRDLLEGRHGSVPPNIALVVAGRHELNRDRWIPYEGVLTRLSLEPFTEEEARDCLARQEVVNERVVEVILGLSGRLPLLVATLTTESPDDPAKVGDRSGEAVERFLKWVEDPQQRRVALDAALPRRLNRDVLAALVGQEEADGLFSWLRGRPFVEKRGDCWTYHDVIRAQMLRHKRQETPQGWADLHGRLATFYESLRDSLGLEEKTGRKDETWQAYALEALYHRLCQSPQVQTPTALDGFVAAWQAQHAFARHWAQAIEGAGKDVGVEAVRRWGQRLVEGLDAYEEGRYSEVAKMFSALLEQTELEAPWRAAALTSRGVTYFQMERYEEALADFTRIIELAPDELNPDDVLYFAIRGEIYLRMERYEEALADFDQAIELKPDDAWAIADRGETCIQMERYEEALADLNQAIELDPDYAWAFVCRGVTHRLMGRYEEALADFNRAIELDPNDWYLYDRALTHQALGQTDQAQADLTAAIQRAQEVYEEKPQNWQNTFNLALYHLAAGEAEEAERLYQAALSSSASSYHIRKAIHDLDDFLALFPDHIQAQAMRHLLQQHLQGGE